MCSFNLIGSSVFDPESSTWPSSLPNWQRGCNLSAVVVNKFSFPQVIPTIVLTHSIMSIHIAIRNVYDSSMSYEYDVDLKISVQEVKEMIQQSIPSHPAIEEMRLIFGGRICNNDDLLEMVFQDTVRFCFCTACSLHFVSSIIL